MAKPSAQGALQSLAELGADALRDTDAGATSETGFDETRWAIGRLSDEGLERLGTFLIDLMQRAPLSSPAWVAHKMVMEAFEADIQRERLARREEKTTHGA